MSIDASVTDFLNSGGGKSAFDKHSPIGTKVKGTVISAEQRQQIDYDTDKPAFWDDGNPKMQVVIAIQTDEGGEGDDGIRNLFIKGSKKPETMTTAAALVSALKEANAKLEVGGTLAVAYVGEGPQSNPKFNPPKQYRMAYKPPTLDVGGLLDDEPAPVAAPAAAPPAVEEDPFADM